MRTPRGEHSVIDLYYPLPESLDEPEDLPGFDVLWGVQTDTRIVAERTPFERVEVVTAPYVYGVGYSAYWWYDPWYPYYTFLHHPVLAGHPYIAPHSIHIRPHPWGGHVYRPSHLHPMHHGH